jgi:phage gpG-like protein
MQFTIEFQLDNYTQTLASYKALIKRPRPLLDVVGASVLRETQRRHDQGLAPDGTPWKPLATSTLHAIVQQRQHRITKVAGKTVGARSDFKAAQKIMDGKRILVGRGDLLRFYYQVNSNDVVISTMDQIKANWHHLGTGTHGPKGQSYEIRPKVAKALAFGGLLRKRVIHPGVPARPLVGFPNADRDVVMRVISDHIAGVLAAPKK